MGQKQPQLNTSFYQEAPLPQNINTDNKASYVRYRQTPQLPSSYIPPGLDTRPESRQTGLGIGSSREANLRVQNSNIRGYPQESQILQVSNQNSSNSNNHSPNQHSPNQFPDTHLDKIAIRAMFSPQPRPASPLSVSHSPAHKKLKNDPIGEISHLVGSPASNINFYVLTERGVGGDRYNSSILRSSPRTAHSSVHEKVDKPAQPQRLNSQLTRVQSLLNQPDEDERFLQLAREALVATATGANLSNSLFVDPTISDLLTRLQYALLPHGNPIKKSTEIETNVSGRLNIQGFYKNFPNLSNDIFTDNPSISARPAPPPAPPSQSANHPSLYNDGWNFLIGEPVVLKSPKEREAERQAGLANRRRYREYDSDENDEEDGDGDDGDDERDNDPSFPGEPRKNSAVYSDDPLRKFLCSKCLMSFRRSSDLKRHEKQHLSIPPNICELCGKGFARKDALKRHVSTLTCKRNAEKKLYVENLNYLSDKR